MFATKDLPYGLDEFTPYISADTMNFHYNKHYKGYVDKLNELTAGSEFQTMPLEQVIKESYNLENHGIYNNAAQIWNHEFFFKHLAKNAKRPDNKLIEKNFESPANFKQQFKTKALGLFGSGYCWLLQNGERLHIVTTANGDNPLILGQGEALMGIDIWEHAYYLDYQNRRGDFIDVYLNKLIFRE